MDIQALCLLFLPMIVLVNSLQMERKPHPCPIIPRTDGHRPGHLDQLGCQRPPVGPVKEYFESPTPRELWENHVDPYIPAVIRNALKGSPAIDKWAEDKYFVEEYGDQEVLVEKKYEDRKSEPKRMEITKFLDNYKDENWYVVSILPNAMRKDIVVPKPLMCSSFNKNLAELNLWIGTRGTRSMLHYDADNIMHCVVSGLKDWILIDRFYKDKMDMVIGREGQGSGFSHLDVDKVSEDTNPEVWDVPWQYVTLRSGDCLYLPHKYLHQVRSYNRTVSATMLWYPEGEFTDDDCENINYEKSLNLNDTYVYWTYDKGQETVDMGYMNPEIIKAELISIFDVFGMTVVDLDTFVFFSLVQVGDSAIEGLDAVLRFFADVDHDKNGYITREEIISVDVEVLKDYCRGVDSPHGPTKTMLPTSENYSHKSSEFNPRQYKQRYLDSVYAKTFMKFVMRVKGKNNRLTYPQFKELIHLRDGHPADAFILLDKNFDGVITGEELQNASLKQYRDFSKMRYNLIGTSITGGGKYEAEVEQGNMLFLARLNDIPEKYTKVKDDDASDEGSEETPFMKLIDDLRNGLVSEISRISFMELVASPEDNEYFDSFSANIFFNLLNRDGDDTVTSEDIRTFLTLEMKEGMRDEFSAHGILQNMEEQLERMQYIRPDVIKFKQEVYSNPGKATVKTEL